MAFLEQKPIHVRRRVALIITVCVSAVLILVMVLTYTLKKDDSNKTKNTASTFKRFYATIVENTQSFFSSKDAIMTK
jgi:hypothetical protein